MSGLGDKHKVTGQSRFGHGPMDVSRRLGRFKVVGVVSGVLYTIPQPPSPSHDGCTQVIYFVSRKNPTRLVSDLLVS